MYIYLLGAGSGPVRDYWGLWKHWRRGHAGLLIFGHPPLLPLRAARCAMCGRDKKLSLGH